MGHKLKIPNDRLIAPFCSPSLVTTSMRWRILKYRMILPVTSLKFRVLNVVSHHRHYLAMSLKPNHPSSRFVPLSSEGTVDVTKGQLQGIVFDVDGTLW